MKRTTFRASLEDGPTGACLCDRARRKLQSKWYRNLSTTKWHPSYAHLTFQGNSEVSQVFVCWILVPFRYEEITTGKTGNTRCLRSGHKINWFLAFEALPVFPVVIFRHISRDKGQKAGPHMAT